MAWDYQYKQSAKMTSAWPEARAPDRGSGGRLFDGTFYTDGYGVSILMRSPDGPKGAGKKRKRGDKWKS